jgi:hypothetical protein
MATVLGGLILNHLTSLQVQQAVPSVATPTREPPAVDFSDLIPARPSGASDLPPGFVLDEPAPSVPIPDPGQYFATRGEAERACSQGKKIAQIDNGPRDGPYFGRFFCR